MALTYTSNGTYSGSTATNVVTFSGVSFGTAAADRIVAIPILAFMASGARTISSATIGGISATLVGTETNGPSSFGQVIYANVPTGTSGTVVVTFSGTMNATSVCGSWSVYGSAASPSAFNNLYFAASAGSQSVGCNVPAGGAQLAFVGYGSVRTATWSGATESQDSNGFSMAEFSPGAGATNSPSVTPSSITTGHLWVVSWAVNTTDAVGAAAGTCAASGVGAASIPGAGSASGTGTASGVGRGAAASAGTAAGTGAASGVGRSTNAAVGAASGLGTALGIGAAATQAVGTASGTLTALATSASDTGIGSASGTLTAAGVGASVAAAVGSASGLGSASGASNATIAASGAATGALTASATGRGAAASAGSASAVLNAQAVGTTSGIVSAVGSASGSLTALGAGNATNPTCQFSSAFSDAFAICAPVPPPPQPGGNEGLAIYGGGGDPRNIKFSQWRYERAQQLREERARLRADRGMLALLQRWANGEDIDIEAVLNGAPVPAEPPAEQPLAPPPRDLTPIVQQMMQAATEMAERERQKAAREAEDIELLALVM